VLSHEQNAFTRRSNQKMAPQQDQTRDPSINRMALPTRAYPGKIATGRQDHNQRIMAPPPTPIGRSQHQAAPTPSSSRHFAPGFSTTASRRFPVPSVQRPNQPPFVPSTPTIAPSGQRFIAASSRPMPRISNVSGVSGSQRVPFIASRASDNSK
jgi:hypothetical protein